MIMQIRYIKTKYLIIIKNARKKCSLLVGHGLTFLFIWWLDNKNTQNAT